MRPQVNTFAALGLALLSMACEVHPRPIVAGEDSCQYCRMTIDDARFGAMVITARGRIETFDSVECLASFVASLPAATPPRGVWVANFERPTEWVAVNDARFLHGSTVRSPMGRSLVAFGDQTPDAQLKKLYGGSVLSWADVVAFVDSAAVTPANHPH